MLVQSLLPYPTLVRTVHRTFMDNCGQIKDFLGHAIFSFVMNRYKMFQVVKLHAYLYYYGYSIITVIANVEFAVYIYLCKYLLQGKSGKDKL